MNKLDKRVWDKIHETMPRLNPLLANGLAVAHMRDVERYVDELWRCAFAGMPSHIRYLGPEACTPEEEYAETTRKRENKHTYEVSRSDIYMTKYHFEFEGARLPPRYLYLPFVDECGCLFLRGSQFSISPVITDRVMSVTGNTIFIPLPRDKLNFDRWIHHYYLDGKRETVNVVYSPLYRRSKQAKKDAGRATIVGKTTMVHYLFCRFGFTETFKKYCRTVPQIGYAEDFPEDKYPRDKWHVCSSTMIKPRGYRERDYQGSRLQLMVRKEDYTPHLANYIGGFFYVADFFPDRLQPDNVDQLQLWRILMGHLIFASQVSEGRLLDGVNEHIHSLDQYVDIMAKENLAEEGIYVEHVYDLFAHVIEIFADAILMKTDTPASMYGKKLTVLRYVLDPVQKAIFHFAYAIQSELAKQENSGRPLTYAYFERLLASNIQTRSILRINHGHGEVNTVSCPGDNRIFSITGKLVAQAASTSGTGKHKGKKSSMDASRVLHASLAEVGSYANLQKNDPTGRSSLNLCVNLDDRGMVVRNPEFKDLLDSIQQKIRR